MSSKNVSRKDPKAAKNAQLPYKTRGEQEETVVPFKEAAAKQRMKEIRGRVQQDLLSIRSQYPCADEYEILQRLMEINAHPMAISVQRNRIEKLEAGCSIQDQSEAPGPCPRERGSSKLQAGPSRKPSGFLDEDLPPELRYSRPYKSRRQPRPGAYYSPQSAAERIRETRTKVAEEMRQAREKNPGVSDFEILQYLIETGAHPQTIANLQEKIKRERGTEKIVPKKAPEPQAGTSEEASGRGVTPLNGPPPVIPGPAPRTNPGRLKELKLRGLDNDEEFENFLDMTDTPNISTSVQPPCRRLFDEEREAPTSGGDTRKRYSWQPVEEEERFFQPTERSGPIHPSYRPTKELRRKDPLSAIPEEPNWLDEHKARLGAVREIMRARGLSGRLPLSQERPSEPCTVQVEEQSCEDTPAKDKDWEFGRSKYYYLAPVNITQYTPENTISSHYERSMGTPARSMSPSRTVSRAAHNSQMAAEVCERTVENQRMETTPISSRPPMSLPPSSPMSGRSREMDDTQGVRNSQMTSGDCNRALGNQQMEKTRVSARLSRSMPSSSPMSHRQMMMSHTQGDRSSQTANNECYRTVQSQPMETSHISSRTPRNMPPSSPPSHRSMMTNLTQGNSRARGGPTGTSTWTSFDIGEPPAESTRIEFNRTLARGSSTRGEECPCNPTTEASARSSFSGLPAWLGGETTGKSSRSCWSQQSLKKSPSKVKNMIDEEKKEVRAMHEVMSLVREPSTQVQFKDMNALVPHVFSADETETAPEVAAKMLYSDEKGLSLKATPAKVYNMLFHGEGDSKTVIKVNAPSISSKAPVLVPLSSEGVEASLSGYPQENYMSLPNEEETPMPSLSKETGEVGNIKDNLGYSASSIGKSSSSSLGDDRFKIILEPDLPKERDLIQVRGSQPPPWFPGYYAMMGNDIEVNVVDKPWVVLERAWRQMIPEKIKTETGKIIVGS